MENQKKTSARNQQPQLDETYAKVCALWGQTGQDYSLREIAQKLDISVQKVRKILITEGLYTSPEIQRIQALIDSGMSVEEVADQLGLTRNAVSAALPYRTGPYYSSAPSPNALAIRRWKENKNNDE